MEVVIDASALLALLHSEPGAHIVESALPDAIISSGNLAEVVGKLSAVGMPGPWPSTQPPGNHSRSNVVLLGAGDRHPSHPVIELSGAGLARGTGVIGYGS